MNSRETLLEEIDVVTELTKRCIAENSQTAQNQEEYAARYNGFVERYSVAFAMKGGAFPKTTAPPLRRKCTPS